MKRFLFSLLMLAISCTFLEAQTKKWTIQECIDFALQNNLEVKRSDITIDIAASQLDQSKLGRYPNLNSSMSHAYNFGRSIDPFTNQFENQSVQSNSFNLTSSVTLYNAGKLKNTVNRNEMNQLVNREDRNVLTNSVSLRVADAYLQILFAEEQLKIAEKQEKLSREQRDIARKLFDAGKTDRTELSNMEAQLSNNSFQVLSAKNSIQLAYLTMTQLLQLPPDVPFEIEIPQIDVDKAEISLSLNDIIDQVLQNFPEMKSAKLRVESALISEKIARSDIYPRLSLIANLNTVYSQSRKERINPVQSFAPIGLVEGTNDIVLSPFTTYDFQTTPFADQLRDNFGQSLRLNLSIPIFNGHQVKNNIRQSELSRTREEINLLNTKNQLINDVTRAYTQYVNSKKEYFAAQQNYTTQKFTYDLNKKKYDAGLINASQMLVFRTNMDVAEINMNRLKYQYVFAKLRVYFYQKNTIQIN